MATVNYGLNARSNVADGGVAHIIDTTNAYSSGTLVSFRENATQFAFFDSAGHFNLNDNIRLTLGTGGDADIWYDGTDLNIDPDIVGSGVVAIAGAVTISTTLAVTGNVTITGELLVNADDGSAIGASGTAWSDLFLASGAVVNFNAGDVTVTHSSNDLAIAGGSTTVDSLLISSDDGGAIGATGTAFSDLFLASGGVINFDTNDVTITHTSNTLTVAGGTWACAALTADDTNIAKRLRLTLITTFADDATPSVDAGNLFKTGGTTTITDFDDGQVGQTIHILAAHSITITDNAAIILAGGANFAMVATDTLTLTSFDSQVWNEIARSVN